jgi:gluconokinase
VYAWCRDVLKLPSAEDVERILAERAPDSHGLTLLPFLAGERAPGWRGDRRAIIAGLSLSTTAVDVVHAAMEAVTLRLMLIYKRLAALATPDHLLVASGGSVARSRVWTRMLADGLGRPIYWSPESEATSRGAALLALEVLGALPDLAAAPASLGEVFAPDAARHARYLAALERQQHLDERV